MISVPPCIVLILHARRIYGLDTFGRIFQLLPSRARLEVIWTRSVHCIADMAAIPAAVTSIPVLTEVALVGRSCEGGMGSRFCTQLRASPRACRGERLGLRHRALHLSPERKGSHEATTPLQFTWIWSTKCCWPVDKHRGSGWRHEKLSLGQDLAT